MFSPHSKKKYDVSYACVEEDREQPDDEVEAQLEFFYHLIDETEVPAELEEKVYGTGIRVGTLREAVRYAQLSCAEVLFAVAEQDAECLKLGMPEEHGERFTYYRGLIEDACDNFPRGEHIGDETWLQKAEAKELIAEAKNCVNERYYMEGVWDNMDRFIKTNKACKERREKGLVSVYKKPDRKHADDEGAMVKWAGTSTRGGRYTRNAQRGGRSEGSFRGWK